MSLRIPGHHVPLGWCLPSQDEVDRELARPDGLIQLIKLKRRPFFARLRNLYVGFRKMGIGPMRAFRGAWTIARI